MSTRTNHSDSRQADYARQIFTRFLAQCAFSGASVRHANRGKAVQLRTVKCADLFQRQSTRISSVARQTWSFPGRQISSIFPTVDPNVTDEMGEICGTFWVQWKYHSQTRHLNICHQTLHISVQRNISWHLLTYLLTPWSRVLLEKANWFCS